MSDVDSAWKEVGEKFSQLGGRFRDHYKALEDERRASAETAEEAEQEVKKAFAKVSEELDTAFTSVGHAFRDGEVKEDAKAAGQALLSALGTTFSEIGDALQRALGGRKEEVPAPAAEETPAPPAAEEPPAPPTPGEGPPPPPPAGE